MQTTFFYLGKFLKKLADDQCSFNNKGRLHHIKNIFIKPVTMGVAWSEIGYLMEVVCNMFNICTYCVFTLHDDDRLVAT